MLDFFSEGANCVGTGNNTLSWSYKRFMNTRLYINSWIRRVLKPRPLFTRGYHASQSKRDAVLTSDSIVGVPDTISVFFSTSK
jgi:hypothetical protein